MRHLQFVPDTQRKSTRVIGDPFDWQLLLINNGRDWLDTLDTACGKRTNHSELYESCYITETISTIEIPKSSKLHRYVNIMRWENFIMHDV